MRLFPEIIDTKKENNSIFAFCKKLLPLNINASFVAKVDTKLRADTTRTTRQRSTQPGASQHFGEHVEQKDQESPKNTLRFGLPSFC
jgi:alanyl-tRNA synthetase